LALCGAMYHEGTSWVDLRDALREADLSFIEKQFPNYPYPNVLRALKVSVDSLSQDEAERYQELLVFPEDANVLEEVVLTLWTRANMMSERNARDLLIKLKRKALLRLEGKEPHRRMSLHDLQRDYLRATVKDVPSLHNELLVAYQAKCPQGWHTGPRDGYFAHHLIYHLREAGRTHESLSLLTDFKWLYARIHKTAAILGVSRLGVDFYLGGDINGLIDDFDWSHISSLISDFDHLSDNDELKLIQSAIRSSIDTISKDINQLASELIRQLQAHRNMPLIYKLLLSIEGL